MKSDITGSFRLCKFPSLDLPRKQGNGTSISLGLLMHESADTSVVLLSQAAWVSTVPSTESWPDFTDARSLISIKNSPLEDNWSGKLWPIAFASRIWFWVSITAPKVLKRVLDSKKGVAPGTTAIFNLQPWMGTTNAYSLCKRPWLPNRNVRLQAQREILDWRSGLRFLMRSATNWLPITVLVAPKSTIPWLPWDAKYTACGEEWFDSCDTSGKLGWFLRLKRWVVASIDSFLGGQFGFPKWLNPLISFFMKDLPQTNPTVGVTITKQINSNASIINGWHRNWQFQKLQW